MPMSPEEFSVLKRLPAVARTPMCLAIAFVLVATGGLSGQTAAVPPAFEVASIKPSDPLHGSVLFSTYPGGRIRISHLTLKAMIAGALKVQSFQISNGPAWIDDQRYIYDIDARPPASAESSKSNPSSPKADLNEEQLQMVLTLLADRFQLKFHRETSEGPIFLLMKGNKPLKLAAPKDKDAFPWVGSATDQGMMTGTGIHGINASMPLLAESLMWYFERPVFDKTGIEGSFDFRYELPLEGPPITSSRLLRSPEVLSSIVTSAEAIGLKLETSKARVETIVIDHAEKPSPN